MLLQPFGEKNSTANEQLEKEIVVLYKRVSAEEQKKSGLGLQGQEFSCREYVKKKFPNAEIVEVYSDEGISADKYSIAERKNLSQMLADAKRGMFNIIITFKQDRLARKPEELEYICKATESFGVRIFESDSDRQLNEAIPQNILTRQMLASFSQFEIELTRSRIKATKASQKAVGKFSGGQLPYGFIWDKENELVIEVAEEIRVWLSIIHKFLFENKGSVVIARELNEAFIPYRTGNKKSVGESAKNTWSKDNVLSLLKNPILTGNFPTNVITRWTDENGKRRTKRNNPKEYKLEETHLLREIIPLEMWEMIINKLEEKTISKPPTRQMTTSFILSGILKCSNCSATMQTKFNNKKDGKKYSYYVCRNPHCDSPIKSHKKEDVESFVLNKMKEAFSIKDLNQENILKMSNDYIKGESKDLNNHIDLLENDLQMVLNGLQKIKNDYTLGDLSASEYKEFKNALEERKSELVDMLKIKELEVKSRVEKREEVIELIDTINLLEKTFEEDSEDEVLKSRKRALILTLVDSVKWMNGTFNILYRYESGNAIPNHLKRTLDENLNRVFTEIIKGEKEISATSEAWVSNKLHKHVLTRRNPLENPLFFKLLNMVSKLNERKKIELNMTSNSYVSTIRKDSIKKGA